jgi:uncharacterized protein
MNVQTILILIVIGFGAGILGGMFGIGGAVIMIPAMVLLLKVDQHTAQGTSVAIMLPPIGLLAAYNYYKAGQVNILYAAIIAAAFIVGGYFGSKMALSLPENLMRKIFGVLLVIIALRMIFFRGVPSD